MNKRGHTRTSSIMFNLWLGGAVYPFTAVREAAVKEYCRLRKAVARSVPIGWDPRASRETLTPRSRAAVLRGLNSGPDVITTLPPETLLQAAGTMLFAVEMPLESVFELFPAFGVPKSLIEEEKRDRALSSDLVLGLRTLAGLVADPAESAAAGETALAQADEETFLNIRDYTRVAPFVHRMLPALLSLVSAPTDTAGTTSAEAFLKVAQMMGTPEYRLLLFVLMVRRAQLKGDHGRGLGEFVRSVIVPVERLVGFIASDQGAQALLRRYAAGLDLGPGGSFATLLPILVDKHADPAVRPLARKIVRVLWRHGLSDLLQLRKTPRRRAVAGLLRD